MSPCFVYSMMISVSMDSHCSSICHSKKSFLGIHQKPSKSLFSGIMVIKTDTYLPSMRSSSSYSLTMSLRKCIRCYKDFNPEENTATSCNFHGDIIGNSIGYNLYEDHHFDDPSLNNKPGPRFGNRWGCCQEKEADAAPCKLGYHITYDSAPEERSKDISLRFPN